MVQHQHSWPTAHRHAVGTVTWSTAVAAATIMVTIMHTWSARRHAALHAARMQHLAAPHAPQQYSRVAAQYDAA